MKKILATPLFVLSGLLGLSAALADDADISALSDEATQILLLQDDSKFEAQKAQISEKYADVLKTDAEDEEVGDVERESKENWKPVLPNDVVKRDDSVPTAPKTDKVLSTEASASELERVAVPPKFSAEAIKFDPNSAGLVDAAMIAPSETSVAPRLFSGNLLSTWQDGFMREGRAMQLNQAWLTAERKAKSERGRFDWGGRVDANFGTTVLQSLGDRGFDGKWGISGDGYAASIYQAYGEIATGRLTTKVGKFATLLEYESTNAIHGGFNTHTYAKEHEPETHSGVLFEYRATEKFALKFGLTTGSDVSLENRRGDSGFLFGVGWELSDRVEFEYASVLDQVHSAVGENRALLSEGYYELGGVSIGDHNDYLQTVSLRMKATDRLTLGVVNDYGVMSDRAEHLSRYSQFGIGNYLSYAHNDQLSSNVRYEYYFQRLGSSGKPAGTNGAVEQHCHDLSYGLVYKPFENVLIRPEVRYDWIQEADGAREKGFTGGVSCGMTF